MFDALIFGSKLDPKFVCSLSLDDLEVFYFRAEAYERKLEGMAEAQKLRQNNSGG